MTTKPKIREKADRQPPKAHTLDSTNPKLKYIGGSNFDAWNGTLANQALSSGWYGNNPDAERTHKLQSAGLSFLAGIEPKDQLEGRAKRRGLDESLLQAIEHVFQMSVSRHAFEGDFVVPRPLLRISCLIFIGFVHLHMTQERD